MDQSRTKKCLSEYIRVETFGLGLNDEHVLTVETLWSLSVVGDPELSAKDDDAIDRTSLLDLVPASAADHDEFFVERALTKFLPPKLPCVWGLKCAHVGEDYMPE